MIIHYYSLCWNEERMLPLTLEYYSGFCKRVTVFDNESTDNSPRIIEELGGVLRSYSSGNEIRDDIYLEIKNNCWKESRGKADWVIVGDIDEILYSTNLPEKLAILKEQGYTIIKPHGFDMVLENFPGNLLDVKFGMPDTKHLRKCICFDPNSVEEINFKAGCHKCKPKGNVKYYDKRDILLLHYKFMGLDYLLGKTKAYKDRLSQINKDNKWGKHYELNEDELEKQFLKRWNKAVIVPK